MKQLRSLCDELLGEGVRVTVDLRSEQIGGKIRLSETEKIPYMVILGSKEVENNHVSLRRHKIGDIGGVPKYQFKADLIKRNH